MPRFTPIIGMEVHVELNTNSKMFCACANNPDEANPNTNICEICTAQPGTLPVPNKEAIISTVKISKALGGTIRELSKFDRKHYFYPDLPKGYQISQYDEPIGEYGKMTLEFQPDENIRDTAIIGIRRIHLEEDTAKLFHGNNGTLVDFNRAGTPLVEIVTDPDFMSALEAKTYCQELRTLLRTLGVSDADMEKGHMRCEANISLQPAGSFEIINGVVKPLKGNTLNPKVELKNLNSFKAVEKGIAFEIARQTKMIEDGVSWVQQTRGWNEDEEITVLQRTKENAADYRYFPEPDIPPFYPVQIAGNISLPELPQAKRRRFREEYGLSYADAMLLSQDKIWAQFTEEVMSEAAEWIKNDPEAQTKTARLVGGWITSKLMGGLIERKMEIGDIKFTPENFAELISLIYTEKVNSTNAQKILNIMIDHDRDIDPSHIMEEHGLGQVRDTEALGTVADEIIKSYPKQVADFKAGKESILKFLIGMAMKATEGSADPKMLEELLREKISSL
ncbi:MAG TPA: Asp-tRNA(Asn)/Glu-tRNA(Gln) amidotransferase subunit GatB [Candidatus Magasanikbacteria bacterium]|nr:Asp-tRNA(Asn)/Glu-tRNA(Gln) amidotransferase subunit GatB [Candidatus Magasanikbacteria bacterium]